MTESEQHDYGEILVLQHQPEIGPAGLVTVLDARAHQRPWRLVDVAAGAPAPALDRVAGILVLGGRMGVPDRADHPWMEDELELLRTATERAVPILGICLGAQLLATALGGDVARRDVPEVGYLALRRTPVAQDDPVFAGWPDGSAVLLLHEDEVVRLPEGATPLLEGAEGHAAWRAPGTGSYAVQFHPEVTAATIAGWTEVASVRQRCEAAGVDPDVLTQEAERRDAFHRAVGLSLIGRWMDAVVGADDPDPKRRRRDAVSRRSSG